VSRFACFKFLQFDWPHVSKDLNRASSTKPTTLRVAQKKQKKTETQANNLLLRFSEGTLFVPELSSEAPNLGAKQQK